MLYQFDDELTSVNISELKDNTLTIGFVSQGELERLYKTFNIPLLAVEICKSSVELSTYLEAYDHCYFIRLGIIDDTISLARSIGIIICKDLLLIVNINDSGGYNRDLFFKMLNRLHLENASAERALLALLESITYNDNRRLDSLQKSINELEGKVIKNNVDAGFNANLLKLKGDILTLRAYYEGLIDITHSLLENDNEVLGEDIKRLHHFSDKLKLLKDSTDILTDSALHLWDAYQALMDIRLNETMKFFTLVTTIFFPLTVIVGWYGMNFTMPELNWKYGYIYVIIFSACVIALLIFWFKRKKWL